MNIFIRRILFITGGLCFIINAYHAWDYLPVDDEISGWERDSSTQQYKIWNDDNHPNESLYDFIDGGADVYLNRGFREGTIMSYFNEGIEIGVTIYDQTLADSAKVLYHELSQECVGNVASSGDSACLVVSLFSSSLHVIYNNYYFCFSFPNDSLSLGIIFVETIIGKINNSDLINQIYPVDGNILMSINTVLMPGSNIVKIFYAGVGNSECWLRIFDISGQLVKESKTISTKQTIWNTAVVTSGFYFIELKNKKNRYCAPIMVIK